MTLEFFKIVANLKNIPRQGWIDKLSITNPESVADHCFSMSVMSMVIADLGDYDSEKTIKMVLLHDLAESKIGDLTPGKISKEEKLELENNAFNEIIKKLPDSVQSSYLQLWQEYQQNKSPESKLVHQIDKLEMALQALIYNKDGYTKEKLESFIQSARQEITDEKLKELFTKIVGEIQ